MGGDPPGVRPPLFTPFLFGLSALKKNGATKANVFKNSKDFHRPSSFIKKMGCIPAAIVEALPMRMECELNCIGCDIQGEDTYEEIVTSHP